MDRSYYTLLKYEMRYERGFIASPDSHYLRNHNSVLGFFRDIL